MRQLTEGARLAARYSLQRPLGSGGTAVLWLAYDARSESPVALKFLADDWVNTPQRREEFHREWQIASRLMHAHIARVFEYHDEADGPFYAQQYLDGPSIAELAGQPLELLLRPIGFLADALRYAHGKQIVHGDITAANLRCDQRGAPYLVDFGCARAIGAHADGAGTPVARSPQLRAGEAVTAADDIYAMGVVLHELLFNRPPNDKDMPAVTSSGERLPGAISELLQTMLASDTSVRPSAEQLAEALQAAGFAPGAAVFPEKRRGPVDTTEITVRPVKPSRATVANNGPVVSLARRGIPSTYVVAGLAVMLAALLGVLFLLPGTVETNRGANETTGNLTSEKSGADTVDEMLPDPAALGGELAPLDQNRSDSAPASAKQQKDATDEALGDLLSRLERLRGRGIERWGGAEYQRVMAVYAAGDKAYVDRDYAVAREKYLEALAKLEPFFDQISTTFDKAMADAKAAFGAEDYREAIRLYDLAVAITPGHPEATRGLERARSLESVLSLTERGRLFENNLEYAAAREAYERALELDALWQPAVDGLARVRAALEQRGFEQRMTEGFAALASGNFDVARAAFETARSMRPSSSQPKDGLLQLDQALRLDRIQALKSAAQRQEEDEQWELAVESYGDALSVDPDLEFAQRGLQRATYRAGLHSKMQAYIDEPDSLSAPQRMQAATNLLLELSRVSPSGPRLEDQKETLARLLKRAATPLSVQFRSDNMTDVSIYRVGPLGTFGEREIDLRPGRYVAVGSRPGYRDVRLEFRVAPEIEMQPVVVRCEEAI
ncbi:MAG: protein kinase [Woeseia sp.]|nr:protein kinase [Woeseia sp.]